MANPNNFDSLFANGSFSNSSIGNFANAAVSPFMTKSPFTDFKWQHLKRDTKEIEELFFPSIKGKSYKNLYIRKELDCNCDIELAELGNGLVVYNESGKTKGFQEKEDKLLFYIKIFVSKDGLKVAQAAKKCMLILAQKPQKR
jgi:hypothetical protein